MNKLIETHAHIYSDKFQADIDEVLERSWEEGLDRIYMPNINHESIDGMLELENKDSRCIPMMGLHPCSVNKDFEKELYLVEDWLSKRDWVAVGEIGTDLYWDKTFWDQQQEAFKIQCKWAVKYDIPVVIHCRESIDETILLIEEMGEEKLRGVFHCFTGTTDQAKKITELGFYLGIGGVATFKNGGMDTVIPHIDNDKIVLETDSPYLAPAPNRGKRNEPAYISLVASKVAEFKNLSVDEVAEMTTTNALNLFK
ncbi:TatD family hydrolase [Fulvivirga lutimaris]|uniref:TatD family hydrolase n=1 Tax=Fulvivirga lutimaris TaxID=1819566 RepID=UPI0012BCEB7A|nr:TatD family hydrolase [Fulvivirga lutimaris]MTI38558.1 TatD family deoxyribonuclease [Fulvivirga lutimaris]